MGHLSFWITRNSYGETLSNMKTLETFKEELFSLKSKYEKELEFVNLHKESSDMYYDRGLEELISHLNKLIEEYGWD